MAGQQQHTTTVNSGVGITSRLLDPDNLVREFAAVSRFHRSLGVDGIGPTWWHDIGRAQWQRHNPRIYRLYLRGKEIVGFLGLAPLRKQCVDELLAGKRTPWWDIPVSCVHDEVSHDRARFFGCDLFVDSYSRLDASVEEAIRWDLARELRRTNIRRFLAQSSTPASEEICRTVGYLPAVAGPLLHSGHRRRLWCAIASDFASHEPLTNRYLPYLWSIFDAVRARFTAPADGLRLTPAQQRVAYLFYCEGLTAKDCGELVGCKLATIRAHLTAVRNRAEDLPELLGESPDGHGGGLSRALAAYFQEYPGVLQAAARWLGE